MSNMSDEEFERRSQEDFDRELAAERERRAQVLRNKPFTSWDEVYDATAAAIKDQLLGEDVS